MHSSAKIKLAVEYILQKIVTVVCGSLFDRPITQILDIVFILSSVVTTTVLVNTVMKLRSNQICKQTSRQ